jgi:hypothetical protein
LTLADLPRLAAADSEVRDYVNYVDGKRAGNYRMTITNQDGAVTMTAQADINVRIFLVPYKYTYRGTEVWKGGRLLQLESRTNENGKQYAVSAVADQNGLQVKVNGQQERHFAPDVWTTTYWQLPNANARNGLLPLLDADTGRDLNATLQYVGPSQISVAGQVQNCTHYRLSGGVQVELWYDAQERLVHQEWVEDNHKAVLDLVRVQH